MSGGWSCSATVHARGVQGGPRSPSPTSERRRRERQTVFKLFRRAATVPVHVLKRVSGHRAIGLVEYTRWLGRSSYQPRNHNPQVDILCIITLFRSVRCVQREVI